MRRILIIDDDPAAIAVLELMLKRAGYGIYSSTQPLMVIDTLINHPVELIILDWQMPERDGIEVLKDIRNYPEFNDIPVIIASGIHTYSSDLKSALNFGAMDYLRKPINEQELEARVSNAFRIINYHKKTIDLAMDLKNKQLENTETKARLLQNELDKKEREMIAAAINIIQNKKFITCLKSDLFESKIKFDIQQQRLLKQVFSKYDNMANSLNWELFEKRFVELNSNFYDSLLNESSTLTWGELRLCALFRVGFSLKEIAALNYSNYDAVRKAVYRIRKKLGINEKTDINLYLQKY
jgi:DNA-binding response OmpR family regulator/DNA-binding CsgD family transcriptional regulator